MRVPTGFELFPNFSKTNESEENFIRHLLANIAKIARMTKQNCRLTKRKGKEGPLEVHKFCKKRKSNKTIFSCYQKRQGDKCRKNSKNDKFSKILNLKKEERQKRSLKSLQ